MPAIKCMSCKRYSQKEGCELEQSNQYYEFRACMLDKWNFYIQKTENECEVNEE